MFSVQLYYADPATTLGTAQISLYFSCSDRITVSGLALKSEIIDFVGESGQLQFRRYRSADTGVLPGDAQLSQLLRRFGRGSSQGPVLDLVMDMPGLISNLSPQGQSDEVGKIREMVAHSLFRSNVRLRLLMCPYPEQEQEAIKMFRDKLPDSQLPPRIERAMIFDIVCSSICSDQWKLVQAVLTPAWLMVRKFQRLPKVLLQHQARTEIGALLEDSREFGALLEGVTAFGTHHAALLEVVTAFGTRHAESAQDILSLSKPNVPLAFVRSSYSVCLMVLVPSFTPLHVCALMVSASASCVCIIAGAALAGVAMAGLPNTLQITMVRDLDVKTSEVALEGENGRSLEGENGRSCFVFT